MSTNLMDDVQVKKSAGKVQRPMGDMNDNPLEDLLSQAQMAYSSYIGAKQKVAFAYKQREEEEVRNFKEVEAKSHFAYDEALARAVKNRAAAEEGARRAYDDAMAKAAQAYQQETADALKLCRDTISQQWQTGRELIEQVWRIYQGNGVK